MAQWRNGVAGTDTTTANHTPNYEGNQLPILVVERPTTSELQAKDRPQAGEVGKYPLKPVATWFNLEHHVNMDFDGEASNHVVEKRIDE